MLCDEIKTLTYDVGISLCVVAAFAEYYLFVFATVSLKQSLRVLDWNKLIVYCLDE
jgi:hypothetical protein